MKKIVTTFVFLFSVFGLQAQSSGSFAPVGAEWWYSGSVGFGATNVQTALNIKTVGEVTIQGTPARQLEHKWISNKYNLLDPGNPQHPGGTDVIWNLLSTDTSVYTLYVYDNADTVFAFNELFNRFTPLYIFNLNEGDTVQLPVFKDLNGKIPIFNGNGVQDSTFRFVVDSIRIAPVHGVALKTFYINGIADSINEAGFNATYAVDWRHNGHANRGISYTQKFGGTGSGILPAAHLIESNPPFDGYFIFEDMEINCYTDTSITIAPLDNNVTCGFLPLSLKEKEPLMAKPTIYPNPTRGSISINLPNGFSNNSKISLINYLGQTVSMLPSPRNNSTEYYTTLSNLPEGLYLLQIISDDHYWQERLVLMGE